MAGELAQAPASGLTKLTANLRRGANAALGRVLTLIESGHPAAQQVFAQLGDIDSATTVVGFTGAPGAGKSSLISVYGKHLRSLEQRVGVIAVDPTSPISGGSVLGDRIRMIDLAGDAGVFIRSVSSKGHLGGLSANFLQFIRLFECAGWQNVLLETVGTGQSEVEVADYADVNVVVLTPGMGDDVQSIKAGILEIADVLVVNKADRPDYEKTVSHLKGMLELRAGSQTDIPIVATVATENSGIAELYQAVAASAERKRTSLDTHRSRRLQKVLAAAVAEHGQRLVLGADVELMRPLYTALANGQMTAEQAAEHAIKGMLDG